jgi:hypothetical protein
MLFNTKCDVIALLTCHVNTMSTQCYASIKFSTKHKFCFLLNKKEYNIQNCAKRLHMLVESWHFFYFYCCFCSKIVLYKKQTIFLYFTHKEVCSTKSCKQSPYVTKGGCNRMLVTQKTNNSWSSLVQQFLTLTMHIT